MVTENEKDYSEYIQHTSNVFNGQLFMLGFMFAVFAIVLTQLPDPNTLQAQLALFFFSVLLHLIGFQATNSQTMNIYFCRRIPPLSKRIAAFNMLSQIVGLLVQGTTTILFAVWNLPYLTVASGIIWIFFSIAGFVFIVRPFRKWRKTAH